MGKQSAQRVVRFGIQNYLRNGWLSLAATLILAMTLFIVSVFALQVYVIRATTQSIQDKLDMAVYISDSPSEDDVSHFISDIKAYPEVKEVIYLDKSQVINEWNKLHVDQKIKSQVNEANNPLPRTIKLKAHNPEDLDKVADRITQSPFNPNIRNMSYRNNRPVIQQLLAQSKRTTRNGIVVSTIFIILAIVFVYNTIRIIIRFRQDEISIMKLVGATDSFVRGPFIVEGALYGVVAGLMALVGLYFYIQNGLSESGAGIATPDSVVADQLLSVFGHYLPVIAPTLIGFAVVLAIACSWISVHHHLKR